MLESLQSLVDSSFLSLNTAVSGIASKVDAIAKDTRSLKSLYNKVNNISEDVLANKTFLEQIQKENKTMKVLLILCVIANVCIGIGVIILLVAKIRL